MNQYVKRWIISIMIVIGLAGIGLVAEITNVVGSAAHAQESESTAETSEAQTPSPDAGAETITPPAATPPNQPSLPPSETQLERPVRSHLFIHDTSLNMRRRRRIQIMQTAIRKVLDNLPSTAYVGLRAFGHRFPIEGPDVCNDTEIVVPLDRLSMSREDFETQLNMLAYPLIGGGSPVGLALARGLTDLQSLPGPKEVYLYLVDLLKCEDHDPLETIQLACQAEDLHLTIIGFGLKSDMQTLLQNNIQGLGCVDIINLTTGEDAETLPDKLLTRFSVEFRNAEGQLVDPAPGDKLIVRLFQKDREGNFTQILQKVNDRSFKGTTIDTVGLDAGVYFLEVSYREQQLRSQYEVRVAAKKDTYEVIRLGRMSVEVKDSAGNLLDDPVGRQVKVTLTEAGKEIRSVTNVAVAEFDLLPSNGYKIAVSYMVGGKMQSAEVRTPISIQEGNHQTISVPLPIGGISGKVVDMSGRPAPDVEMLLTGVDPADSSKQIQRQGKTDHQGDYMIPDLTAGTYELSYNKPGYKHETYQIEVVGGKMNLIEDMRLFHGIEVFVSAVSGTALDEATVTMVHKATATVIPVIRVQESYRNAEAIPEGEYFVSVQREGYKATSQAVSLRVTDPTTEMSFHLPYYIIVQGRVFNGKNEPLSNAVVEFQNRHSLLEISEDQQQVAMQPDGSFQATLLVTSTGDETAKLLWKDQYNQEYLKEILFSLPPVPQPIDLGDIRLPINFLRFTITDISGKRIDANTISLFHVQTGQTGLQINSLETGIYESVALLNGNYTVRILKEGYQAIEQALTTSDGEVVEISARLHHYVTVSGTVVNGKNDRVSGASITFRGIHSQLTSPQAIVTGKDGHFQTTLVVKTPETEQLEVVWTSPDSGKSYRIETEFRLPEVPVAELTPMNLGEYQLPINFVNVEVHDTSDKGLSRAHLTFISDQGEATPAIERGGGIYESHDLQDGRYDIAIAKEGYKENFLIPDVAVGKTLREVRVGPVILPHYAMIRGKILNGKDEGLPNVDILFGNTQSEQLERCRTDQNGDFTTTLLVTKAGKESWQAIWRRDAYSRSGSLPLPAHPQEVYNLGEIRLPLNFVSLPIADVQGNPLSGVTVQMTHKDGTPIELEEFVLEEIEPGLYQAKNLPDGEYLESLQKEGYEIGKNIAVAVKGGKHVVLDPITLGHYLTVTGKAFNGKQEPVSDATITFSGMYSTLLNMLSDKGKPLEERLVPASSRTIKTNADGTFSTMLLATAPGIEHLTVTWQERELASYPLDVSGAPGTRTIPMPLPINFVRLTLTDVSGKSLSGASVTVTHQTEKTIFSTPEIAEGVYESPGIPDGNYIVAANKEQYQSRTSVITVQKGEVQHTSYHLNHYVIVRGHVTNGKQEDVAAATVTFANLKTELLKKILSGTDGVFEVEILVKELGQEKGEITWTGKYGTYIRPFWIDLPPQPAVVTLAQEDARLPVNFISLGVKSIAATGVSGATVKLTHQATNQVIEARDLGNGNYEGEELPDGAYAVAITKADYKPLLIEDVMVAGGEHRSDLQIPRFFHYIRVSGIVLNGKKQGVPEARVTVRETKRLQEVETVSTRADGSFTLHALVTDIGVETIDVVWNTIYATTFPITLPPVPDHLRLGEIILPINFIVLTVQNVLGENLTKASVVLLKQGHAQHSSQLAYSSASFPAVETTEGVYASPELPDGTYIPIVRKAGYMQKDYPLMSVTSGMFIANAVMQFPHLVTVKGMVTDGKGSGVAGVSVHFRGNNSQMSDSQVITDASGYFSERLQVTGTGKETVTLMAADLPYASGEQFELAKEFDLLKTSGEQELEPLRLPVNFIPLRVQDVSGRAISDATVMLTRSPKKDAQTPPERQATTGGTLFPGNRAIPGSPVINLGNGKYEGHNLADGVYNVSVLKEGYERQEQAITVTSGIVAPETVFELPHYVVIKGLVTDGKGRGVPDALLEFDKQYVTVEPRSMFLNRFQNQNTQVKTDLEGHFAAPVLVKKPGQLPVNIVWNTVYSKAFLVPLPEQPDLNYMLEQEFRLPINFVPLRVTDVLGEGLAGAAITLTKSGGKDQEQILFSALGDGFYEAQELLDGAYTLAIHKEGYQDVAGEVRVQGGEQTVEQQLALPHFVTLRGTVVNGKGVGVAGAQVVLKGLSSQLVKPGQKILTEPDGSFQVQVLVTGSGRTDLQEHLEIAWVDALASPLTEKKEGQLIIFDIAHDFYLPPTPGIKNLGVLALPANFAFVAVRDISGKGLSGVNVNFIDEQGRTFTAKEFAGGWYEGQNLPNGIYTVKVAKDGYKEDQKVKMPIGMPAEGQLPESEPQSAALFPAAPLTFQLPYYVNLEGTTVDGKGQKIASNIVIELAGSSSKLLPETLNVDQDGNFRVQLLVNAPGREQLHLRFTGEHGLHSKQVPFMLPAKPETVNLQRITLPVNFIPIEVKDLNGYGVEEATVTLYHLDSGKKIPVTESGNGQYEGTGLLDGSYKISVAKEGYKSAESSPVSVAGGVVSELKSFRLKHYVWITGVATNGEGTGVRDPVIQIERLGSLDIQQQSDLNGKFEVKLEVQEVKNEKLSVSWKNIYRSALVFKIPPQPTRKNLGEVRLPINFISILATDISGSTLRDVNVTVEDLSKSVAPITLKTDQNGFCKTYDLPNGRYKVSVEKSGYKLESREVQASNGNVAAIKFMLAHYIVVRGEVKDIMGNPIEGVDVIFEEFTDTEGQKLRTTTNSSYGRFEQRLLIDNPKFLERQKGYFHVKKGDIEQVFTFKIPMVPEQVLYYKTLLFPTNYFRGKVVDADVRTIPIPNATITLTVIPEPPALSDVSRPGSANPADEPPNSRESVGLSTNSLGAFEIGNLLDGEYKIVIQKEGYVTYEDFIRISGLLQEQEFSLHKE